MEFYRYDLKVRTRLGFPDPVIRLSTYKMEKETPCGYWLDCGKWVSKTARKRYAYPTKEEAAFSFKKRTNRRIALLENQLVNCRIGLKMFSKNLK